MLCVLLTTAGWVAPLRPRAAKTTARCCEVEEPPKPPQTNDPAKVPLTNDQVPTKTYSTGWSGEGKYADEEALPLSFWLTGNSPRRAVIAGLISSIVGPAVNLWGSGSFLLSLNPDLAREKRLDTFYPVSTLPMYPYNAGYLDYTPGFQRYVDQGNRCAPRLPNVACQSTPSRHAYSRGMQREPAQLIPVSFLVRVCR